jgi:hypothetical protein
MKLRPKFTPLNALLGATVIFAALSAAGLVRPSSSDDNAETDRCLVEELTLHPDNATAHYFRALLKMKTGDLTTARAELDKARSLDPSAAFAGGGAALAMVERDITSPPKPAAGGEPMTRLPLLAAALSSCFGLAAGYALWRRRQSRRTQTT